MNKFRLLDCDISLQVKIWAKSQLNASNKSPGKKKQLNQNLTTLKEKV